MGFPTETTEETLETIKLGLRLPLDFVKFNLPIPYPGTKLYQIAREEGFEAHARAVEKRLKTD